MLKVNFIILLVGTFFLLSCKQDKAVEILNGGIDSALTVTVQEGDDLGTKLIGDPDIDIHLTIKNNSSESIKNISLTIDDSSSMGVIFKKNDSNKAVFPGKGGTCSNVIKSNEICSVVLLYSPKVEGSHKQKITINYSTLQSNKSVLKEIKVLAGREASLIFTSGTSLIDLNIIERVVTNSDKKYVSYNIKNAGGLPAIGGGNFTIFNSNIYPVNTIQNKAMWIESTTCPEDILQNTTCSLTIGYLPTNSDLINDEDSVDYSATISSSYIKDPYNRTGALSGTVKFTATTIRAKIYDVGGNNFSFNMSEPVLVGTKSFQNFTITNLGYKEGYLKSIYLYKDKDTIVARCIKDSGSNNLKCIDPNSTMPSSYALGNRVSTREFPFMDFVDIDNCIIPFDQLAYSRSTLPSTSYKIGGKSLSDSTKKGRICNFSFNFMPSNTYIKDENDIRFQGNLGKTYWSNLQIGFEYDTTWKDLPVNQDTIGSFSDIQSGNDIYAHLFDKKYIYKINDAIFKRAGLLKLNKASFSGTDIFSTVAITKPSTVNLPTPTILANDNSVQKKVYQYDLGQIPIISRNISYPGILLANYPTAASPYSVPIKFQYTNLGEEIISGVRGKFDDFTESSLKIIDRNSADKFLNEHIKNVAFSSSSVSINSSQNLSLTFLPVSFPGQPDVQVPQTLFNVTPNWASAQGTGSRRFLIEYIDGATFEDDGVTPRARQSVEVQFKAVLVGNSKVVYHDEAIKNQTINIIAGNKAYTEYKLINLGTIASNKLALYNSSGFQDMISGVGQLGFSPYKIFTGNPATIPGSTATNNCIDYVDFTSNFFNTITNQKNILTDPTYVPVNSSLPGDGGSCAFIIQSSLPNTFRYKAIWSGNIATSLLNAEAPLLQPPWSVLNQGQSFIYDITTPIDRLVNTNVQAEYASLDNSQTFTSLFHALYLDKDGVTFKDILKTGSSPSDTLELKSTFDRAPNIIPGNIMPFDYANILRRSFSLDFTPVAPNTRVLPARFAGYGGLTNFAIYNKQYVQSFIPTADNAYNYIVQGGTYKADTTTAKYDFSFQLINTSPSFDTTITNINFDNSGSTDLTLVSITDGTIIYPLPLSSNITLSAGVNLILNFSLNNPNEASDVAPNIATIKNYEALLDITYLNPYIADPLGVTEFPTTATIIKKFHISSALNPTFPVLEYTHANLPQSHYVWPTNEPLNYGGGASVINEGNISLTVPEISAPFNISSNSDSAAVVLTDYINNYNTTLTQKVFIIKNTGSVAAANLKILHRTGYQFIGNGDGITTNYFVKDNAGGSIVLSRDGGSTTTTLNSCLTLTSLAPAAECYFFYRYSARSSAYLSYRMSVGYSISDPALSSLPTPQDQYNVENILIGLSPKSPIKSTIKTNAGSSVSTQTIGGKSTYIIDYGNMSNPNHVILDASYTPKTTAVYDVLPDALSTDNLSFEKEYMTLNGGLTYVSQDPNSTMDIGTWVNLKTFKGTTIKMTEPCFYGFTLASNTCKIKFTYTPSDSILHQPATSATSPNSKYTHDKYKNQMTLEYFNYKTASKDSISFAFIGDIEIKKITTSTTYNQYNGLINYSDGSFTIPTLNPSFNGETIYGFRVFYSQTLSKLSNIYNTFSTYKDVPFDGVTQPTVSLSLANPSINGFKYYVKIAAIMKSIANEYYLIDTDLSTIPIQQFVVPPLNTFYNHSDGLITDKITRGSIEQTYTASLAMCNSLKVKLSGVNYFGDLVSMNTLNSKLLLAPNGLGERLPDPLFTDASEMTTNFWIKESSLISSDPFFTGNDLSITEDYSTFDSFRYYVQIDCSIVSGPCDKNQLNIYYGSYSIVAQYGSYLYIDGNDGSNAFARCQYSTRP